MFRGTLIAQVFSAIGAIYLAKIYGADAYGFLGFFISIASISSIINTLQLDKCIVTSNSKRESANWLSFVLILIPLITFIVYVALVFTSKYFEIDKLNSDIIIFSTIGALLLGYNIAHESFFTFKKSFSIISNSKVFITISNLLLQIVLYQKYKFYGLIFGVLFSQLLLMAFFFFKNRKEIRFPSLSLIKKGAKSNITLVKYLLPSNIINGLANHIMPVLILVFFGSKEAGVYFFSVKILSAPLFLISSSVSQVYFKKSSELYKENRKELLQTTKKVIRINLIFMALFLIAINTVGIYILELYFVSNWDNLRYYVLILSVLIFARTSFNPISSLIVVLNKNLMSLVFNIYLLLINLIAIYVGYLYSNISLTILILSIFGSIGYFCLLAYFLVFLKKESLNNV